MAGEDRTRVILGIVHYQTGCVCIYSLGPLGKKGGPAPGIYRGFIHQTDECVRGIPVQHTIRSKAYHRRTGFILASPVWVKTTEPFGGNICWDGRPRELPAMPDLQMPPIWGVPCQFFAK
jgi:hypothetical protein